MDIAGVARRIPDAIAKVPCWGPFWDHTFCALVNDLRVCGRHARPPQARTVPATWENVLPRFTGGQVHRPFAPRPWNGPFPGLARVFPSC